MSVIWICTVCEMMVDLLSLIGILLNVPVSILGLTMLAWGNSAGDFVANPAIAKIGMQKTAITACFAGPLFNILIGFGGALIVSCTYSAVSFEISNHFELVIAGLSLVGANLVTLGLLLKNQGKIFLFLGKFQIVWYWCFFSLLGIYTFW